MSGFPLRASAPQHLDGERVRDRARRASILVSRLFCLAAGGFLFVDTLLALWFTDFDLAVGNDLPHETWTFFFEFNTWHHLLHLVTASMLLVAATRRSWAPLGALVFGLVYLVLAPAAFIDGDDAFNVFYSADRENLVHAWLALQGVGFGWLGIQGLRGERDGRVAPASRSRR